ncbi:Co2+/Mg2+ efflux protein ApaG [Ancylobacter polymorphus]|jgi:ApaG protein|uniref:Protein ApaG n=1 Tax=Ancylobacter polymorphus TaxID=223390 RepID=A0A9E7CWX4_9HYPH|nr:Co2+/Mg2+ efflux protein ApaG [Ancylobacter polymorphus]MDQ0302363.1 ApaG protein [Ancylobacter polymorphus]UOK71649.1 Co2+/Mg2+ efflux protein ApaG [Ancylobacter polymorphus]
MYRATTKGVQVTVTPRFAPERSDPERSQYFWAYTIEIINLGVDTVQLKSRHWVITDALGRVQEVRGAGVVGEQPVLPPGGHFEYTSGVPLPTSTGIMEGRYSLETTTGETFEAEVPAFSLDVPGEARTLN